MNQRELAAELIRLKQMAKALLASIEVLSARLDGASSSPGTVPPPARPTTRIRRVVPNTRNSPTEAPPRDDPPSTKPGTSARGTYRYVPPSKKR